MHFKYENPFSLIHDMHDTEHMTYANQTHFAFVHFDHKQNHNNIICICLCSVLFGLIIRIDHNSKNYTNRFACFVSIDFFCTTIFIPQELFIDLVRPNYIGIAVQRKLEINCRRHKWTEMNGLLLLLLVFSFVCERNYHEQFPHQFCSRCERISFNER